MVSKKSVISWEALFLKTISENQKRCHLLVYYISTFFLDQIQSNLKNFHSRCDRYDKHGLCRWPSLFSGVASSFKMKIKKFESQIKIFSSVQTTEGRRPSSGWDQSFLTLAFNGLHITSLSSKIFQFFS